MKSRALRYTEWHYMDIFDSLKSGVVKLFGSRILYICVMMFFFKSAEIDVRARKMCSLKLGSTENKKPKKMTTLEMIYDGCWIVLSCVWW